MIEYPWHSPPRPWWWSRRTRRGPCCRRPRWRPGGSWWRGSGESSSRGTAAASAPSSGSWDSEVLSGLLCWQSDPSASVWIFLNILDMILSHYITSAHATAHLHTFLFRSFLKKYDKQIDTGLIIIRSYYFQVKMLGQTCHEGIKK